MIGHSEGAAPSLLEAPGAADGLRQRPPKRRTLKPRAPVAISAAMVSQLNCLPVLGVDQRRYLEKIVPLCNGSVTSLGKLRLVSLGVALEALQRLASEREEHSPAEHPGAAQPETAAAVLAQLGLEVAP